ncbi:unnamed protein product [Rhizophagus irregularis]|uniref:ATP-dependent DNA helicase n=1 Tax=Rhizophagus irregularis TaxID=588596 RepID=A0A915ZLH8_9GLOM|nr:unnamed protein product [Rhizophagus irregularis]CAB5206085.1 unnamed protein product [Rhizophagus irregularis]CAB5379326.1 unnamed protein product [Rhizophagus irregularis]
MLCQSTLWKHVNVMKLKINMRLFNATNNSDTAEQAEFAKWLLEVGEGRVPAISKTESDHIIILPVYHLNSQDLNDLINFVYPDLSMYFDPKYFVNVEYLLL